MSSAVKNTAGKTVNALETNGVNHSAIEGNGNRTIAASQDGSVTETGASGLSTVTLSPATQALRDTRTEIWLEQQLDRRTGPMFLPARPSSPVTTDVPVAPTDSSSDQRKVDYSPPAVDKEIDLETALTRQRGPSPEK